MSPSNAPPPYEGREHDAVPMPDATRISMEDEERPLPAGWIRQFDSASAHHFYVDTQSNPPRSIWVHPLDDEQYIREHYANPASGPSPGHQGDNSKPQRKGLFGRLRDKAMGSREEKTVQRERDEEKRRREFLERRRLLAEQQHEANRGPFFQQPSPLYTAGYRNTGFPAPSGPYGRRRMGGGMGMPLFGGLAGGLLLGDMMNGGFGDGNMGGGYDGGGFDGGGFDGGGFDGGF
ncbi:hypothetical protein FRB99_006484 [Tulasnella sp. 403]|nr:hypothetical protein FRB99_006484 [Tulasnella sp. 403]